MMLRGEPRMKPDVQYTRNGDVSLAYQVVGDGERDLLVVSGFVSNLEYAWEYPSLSRFLSRLAESSRLILIDVVARPLGSVPRRADAGDHAPRPRDRAGRRGIGEGDALRDVGRLRNVSTLFAATFPERVASLILFTASAAQKPADDYPWAWNDEEWDGWLGSIRDGWGTRAWVVKNARWMGPGMLDHPDELEAWISYTRVAASPSSAEAVMRTSSETDIRQILPFVRTPTLLLHRVGDQIEPIEGARYMVAKMPNARLVELDGDDGIPWIGDTDAVVREIRTFLGERVQSSPTDRRLVAVLFTDIVGSTERAATLGDAGWAELLREHHGRVREELDGFNGVEVDTAGDGFLATFDGPARAVRCARAICERVRDLGLEIRAGVHVGEIEQVGKDVRGIAVHIGARIDRPPRSRTRSWCRRRSETWSPAAA